MACEIADESSAMQMFSQPGNSFCTDLDKMAFPVCIGMKPRANPTCIASHSDLTMQIKVLQPILVAL
ncbi:unnamed protein product [Fusarium venenatum]|uniref:Uncharacterized protein n=1 Tax=Fusarium venenatum TaxID=56646 RepID=A0A2L2T9R3_9HYPO|nr:uncharacterized protein FVRRES_03111 [Fusarium venenatum]CEI66599.1 unnamed protein product [Fusarium venenatum]